MDNFELAAIDFGRLVGKITGVKLGVSGLRSVCGLNITILQFEYNIAKIKFISSYYKKCFCIQ